jgi:hypothetical protein
MACCERFRSRGFSANRWPACNRQMGNVFLMSTSITTASESLPFSTILGPPGASSCHSNNSALRAFAAGQFLAFDHSHEIAGWLDLEHFLLFIADAAALLSAAHAEPLLAFHGDDFLASRQMLGQGVAPGMLVAL